MKRLIFIFILTSFLTAGCEGNSVAEGYVFDAETKSPIEGVLYRDVTRCCFYYTDAAGKYHIEGPTGSCMLGCQDFDTEFSKPGYKTVSLSNPGKIIFLEKKQQ